MKAESLDILKAKIVATYRKRGDSPYLTTCDRTYSGNEVADEIEAETEFGVKCIDNLIQLTIDLLARDKMKYDKPKVEEKQPLVIFKELTEHQIDKLLWLSEELSWQVGTTKTDTKTMNILIEKGYVTTNRYANGEFWQLTDKGIEQTKRIKP